MWKCVPQGRQSGKSLSAPGTAGGGSWGKSSLSFLAADAAPATQTLISGRQQDMKCENNLYNLGNLRAGFHLKYHIKPISNQIKQTAAGLTKWRTQSEHNYLPACACRRNHLSCIVLYMSQHSMITQRPFPVSTQDSMFVLSRENVDVLALHTRVHDNKM